MAVPTDTHVTITTMDQVPIFRSAPKPDKTFAECIHENENCKESPPNPEIENDMV